MKRSNSEEESLGCELDCTICGSTLIDPRVLACQHVFCLRCIFNLIKRDRAPGVSVKCPFNCSEITTPVGDVRSIKKNPLIASLAATTRRRYYKDALRRREVVKSPDGAEQLPKLPCDWCSAEDVECSLCKKCSGVMCKRCESEANYSDHGFLCCELGERTEGSSGAPVVVPPVIGTGEADVRDAPAAPSAAQQQSQQPGLQNQLRKYDFILSPEASLKSVEKYLRLKVPANVLSVNIPQPILLPHFLQTCSCRAHHDGIDIDAKYQVVIPPSPMRYAPNQRSEDQKLWESKELSLLGECCSTTENALKVLSVCSKISKQLKKSAVISLSTTDVNIILSIAVVLRQVHDSVEYAIRPLVQRLALYGNLTGHKTVERFGQLFIQATSSTVRKQLTRRITGHLEMSTNLSGQVEETIGLLHTAITSLGKEILELELVASASIERALDLSVTPVAGGNIRCRISPLLRLSDTIPDLEHVFVELTRLMSHLTRAVKSEVHEATRSVGLRDTARDSILQLEKSFIEEVEKFVGITGSIQHIHVLWLQTILVLGKRFERNSIDTLVAVRAFGHYNIDAHPSQDTALDRSVKEASALVASIAPQITTIRAQHITVLNRNPSTMSNLQHLQGQLCSLTLQVLDLFQKEHFLKLREKTNSMTDYLVALAATVSCQFVDSQSQKVACEIYGNESGTAPVFDGPSSEVSNTLTNLGTTLNKRCGLIGKESDGLLDHAKALGKVAAVLLHSEVSCGAPPVAVAAPGEARGQTPSHPSVTAEVDVESDLPYDDECREYAMNRAKMLVARDVSKLQARNVVVELSAVQKVLLPFYRGNYLLPDMYPDKVFEYLVDAQTGELVVEDIPETRLVAFLSRVSAIANNKPAFVIGNLLLSTGFFLWDNWRRT